MIYCTLERVALPESLLVLPSRFDSLFILQPCVSLFALLVVRTSLEASSCARHFFGRRAFFKITACAPVRVVRNRVWTVG